MQLPLRQGDAAVHHGAGAAFILQEDPRRRRRSMPDAGRHRLNAMGHQGRDRRDFRRVSSPRVPQIELCARDGRARHRFLLLPRFAAHPHACHSRRLHLPRQLPNRNGGPALRGAIRVRDASETAHGLCDGFVCVGMLSARSSDSCAIRGAYRRFVQPADYLLALYSSCYEHRHSDCARVPRGRESASFKAGGRLGQATRTPVHHRILPADDDVGAGQRHP
mmetsp:Transcript_48597/g.114757  ORF Transcript_48597/g.114757 Transcript_48597/m.114757 type:complete len:221 (-) Transcript_48597:1022-1684(-)